MIMDNLVEKWKQVLLLAPINEVYWENVAMYCEKYADRLAKDNLSKLPIALKILSNIDLSKVTFVDDYKICETKELSVKLSYDEINDFEEDVMIKEQSKILKEYIEKYGGIVINELGYFYGIEKDRMVYRSYILSLNVYRNYKLKKINGKIKKSV
jgi:hypothetical protein